MNNFYYCVLIGLTFLKVMMFSIATYRIDDTLALINENLVASCVTEGSKMEAFSNNDITYLAINKELLKSQVTTIMDKNIAFCEHEEKYYFYDFMDYIVPEWGHSDTNSVQIKITVTYHERKYQKVIRYEPVSS